MLKSIDLNLIKRLFIIPYKFNIEEKYQRKIVFLKKLSDIAIWRALICKINNWYNIVLRDFILGRSAIRHFGCSNLSLIYFRLAQVTYTLPKLI